MLNKRIMDIFLFIFFTIILTLFLVYIFIIIRYKVFYEFQFIYELLHPGSFYRFYLEILVFYMCAFTVFALIKKRFIKILILFTIIIVLFEIGVFQKIIRGVKIYNQVTCSNNIYLNKQNKLIYFNCSTNQLIAHAGGEINNYIYTDSLEALNYSYKNGMKFFELDIRKSRDGFYIAMHNFSGWKKMTGYSSNKFPTLEEFKSYKIYKKYTPLTMQKINTWFKNHPDAFLVTDKINNPKNFLNSFKYKNRLYMELFSMKSVLQAIQLGINAMPSTNLVVLLGKNGPSIFKNLNVKYIVAPYNYPDKNLLQKYMQNNIKVFIYGSYYKSIKNPYFYGRYINDVENLKVCKYK